LSAGPVPVALRPYRTGWDQMQAMDTKLQHLIDVLEEQMALMVSMARCLAAERDAVIQGDRKALDREVARKEQLVQQIKDTETRRQRRVDEVSASFKIADQVVTLDVLAAAAPAAWSRRLATCRDDLRRTIGQVREANQANQTLVAQSLSLVQGSLKMLGEIPTDKGTYGERGQVSNPAQAGRLLKGSV